MTLAIGSSLVALQLARRLSVQGDELAGTIARLSSGQRILSAADDPAGLALATQLESTATLASAAIRNATEGISQVDAADSGLAAIIDVLYRMSELAAQSANGLLTTEQRSVLQAEFTLLGAEVDRIAFSTSYNGETVISSSRFVSLQVGFEAFSSSQINYTQQRGTLQSVNLAPAGTSSLSYSIISVNLLESTSAANRAYEAVEAAIDTLTIRRGVLAATQSRLTSAVELLSAQRQNALTAESRIRDVDAAAELATYVRQQIVQNTTAALLAQANQTPQLVLSLLNGSKPNQTNVSKT